MERSLYEVIQFAQSGGDKISFVSADVQFQTETGFIENITVGVLRPLSAWKDQYGNSLQPCLCLLINGEPCGYDGDERKRNSGRFLLTETLLEHCDDKDGFAESGKLGEKFNNAFITYTNLKESLAYIVQFGIINGDQAAPLFEEIERITLSSVRLAAIADKPIAANHLDAK